jgi:hypothetical protein
MLKRNGILQIKNLTISKYHRGSPGTFTEPLKKRNVVVILSSPANKHLRAGDQCLAGRIEG